MTSLDFNRYFVEARIYILRLSRQQLQHQLLFWTIIIILHDNLSSQQRIILNFKQFQRQQLWENNKVSV